MSKNVTPIIVNTSTITALSTSIGVIREVIQRIRKILKIFDPTTFQIAISLFFLRLASAEVISSGRLVPIATIVRPINVSETPKEDAILVADFTKKSAQTARKVIHQTIYNIDFALERFFTLISSSSTHSSPFFEIQKVYTKNIRKNRRRIIPSQNDKIFLSLPEKIISKISTSSATDHKRANGTSLKIVDFLA